jgi:vacuolar-type H+-ATPase subunit H
MLVMRRYKNRRVDTGAAEILLASVDSMNEIMEKMFSTVRQNLKDERDKIINTIKEDLNSAKQKALTRMQ